jgi:hypothetical protein
VAFVELRSNLDYARDLVRGGQHLERLQVGAFDVADLYRAAWVQAVSALDHWVHRELYDRALGFALNVDAPRPARFLTLEIPMRLFEDVHHHSKTLRVVFEAYLRGQFGYQSFQAPDKIKDALRYVSDVSLWPSVAKRMADETGEHVASEQIQGMLNDIVRRRNSIAHEADRDPGSLHTKQMISAREASDTIGRIQQIATAILRVIGLPPAAADQSSEVDLGENGVWSARHVAVDQPGSSGGALPSGATEDSVAVAASRRPTSGAARQDLYRQFWSKLRPIVQRNGWTNASPPAQNWWNLPAGVTGATWALSFARFGCRSEIYFEHPDPSTNLARWRVLADRRDDIVARFGDDLIFDDLPNNKGCRIETRLLGPTIDDQGRWSDVLRWMEDTQTRLRSAIDAVGGVPTVIAPGHRS